MFTYTKDLKEISSFSCYKKMLGESLDARGHKLQNKHGL
jgi:hypothetical protein